MTPKMNPLVRQLSIPWPVPPAMDGIPTMAESFDELHLAPGFPSAFGGRGQGEVGLRPNPDRTVV